MSEWREIKLGDLGTVITGKTPSKNNPEDWGSETLFITPSDYGNYRKWADDSIRKLSADGTERLSNKVLPIGSILVTCIGSDMGKVVMNRKIAITNQQINSIILNTDIIISDFAYYLLVDLYEILRIYGGDGTAVPIVNKGDFEKIDALIPPLEEQRAIASVLSSFDDKIDLLHRQNATLEKIAETLFRQWFVEDPNPEWEERPLSEFGQIICGKTPSKKKPEYFDGEYPFIKIPDMHGKTFVFDTQDSLSEEGFLSQEKKALPAKSINVSCIATVGLVTMNAFPSQTNQQINSIIPTDEYRYYLYCEMKNSYDLLHAMASGGTATLNLNTGNFSKIPVLQPDEETIDKFNEIVSPIFDKIFEKQTQIRTLTALRDTLLPKLMSGEVRV